MEGVACSAAVVCVERGIGVGVVWVSFMVSFRVSFSGDMELM